MLLSNVEGMATTSTDLRCQKEPALKVLINCTDVIKMYKQGMGGVGLIQLAKEQLYIICSVNHKFVFACILSFFFSA